MEYCAHCGQEIEPEHELWFEGFPFCCDDCHVEWVKD